MSAADAEELSEPLLRRGFRRSPDLAAADAVLITTCTVRQHAEDKALSLIGTLRPWKAERPERLLIVAGCAAERLKDWLQTRFPFIDLVVGARSIEQFPALAEAALGRRFDALSEASLAEAPGAPPEDGPSAAFVTIMRGCNYACSYCIVPAVRGPELYRPAAVILEEVRKKVSEGCSEVTLLGQTVNSWRSEFEGRSVDFGGLLRLADRIEGLERVRFMSPHPYYITDGLLSALAETRTATRWLHLPVQSGSNRLLRLMRRNYTREGFLEKTERVRRAVPGIVLSTDFIVGFPSETEEDFQQTLSLASAFKPAWAYNFKYSPREGTEAAAAPDDVSRADKEARLNALTRLMERISDEAHGAQVGKTAEILTEKEGIGRAREGFRVVLDRPVPAGRFVTALIHGHERQTLLGGIHASQER